MRDIGVQEFAAQSAHGEERGQFDVLGLETDPTIGLFVVGAMPMACEVLLKGGERFGAFALTACRVDDCQRAMAVSGREILVNQTAADS
jgi:hypothetical protein